MRRLKNRRRRNHSVTWRFLLNRARRSVPFWKKKVESLTEQLSFVKSELFNAYAEIMKLRSKAVFDRSVRVFANDYVGGSLENRKDG
jgi:hypothetical protein